MSRCISVVHNVTSKSGTDRRWLFVRMQLVASRSWLGVVHDTYMYNAILCVWSWFVHEECVELVRP